MTDARSRWRVVRWLAILAVPAVIAGCGDNDEGIRTSAPTSTPTAAPATRTFTPPATATPTPGSNSSASAACEKLTTCSQCFINQTGQCIGTGACAERLSADVAICINAVGTCNQNTLGDCLFPGCDGNDPTAQCQ